MLQNTLFIVEQDNSAMFQSIDYCVAAK